MKIVKKGDVVFFKSALLDKVASIGHAFSTRLGGVSDGAYQSLNLARALGDKDASVFRNREILCAAAGVSYDHLTSSRQVLGAEIILDGERTLGNASQGSAADKPTGDAHVSALPGQAIMTMSADCALILMADPRHRAVGNAHASRKGSLDQVASNTLAAMTREFQTDPKDVIACISPSIGPCCYELGADAVADVRSKLPYGREFLQERGGKTYLDLWSLNRRQLELAGIPSSQIDMARMCTRCVKEFFFSYRRDGEKSGRFGALIWVNPSSG